MRWRWITRGPELIHHIHSSPRDNYFRSARQKCPVGLPCPGGHFDPMPDIFLSWWPTNTVSPKRKYTLLSSRVLKTEGGQIKSRRCVKATIKLVQTGPSLILKFKEFQNEAWFSLGQLKGGCGAPPTFPLARLEFEYMALPQVYNFSVETVLWFILISGLKLTGIPFFGLQNVRQFISPLLYISRELNIAGDNVK